MKSYLTVVVALGCAILGGVSVNAADVDLAHTIDWSMKAVQATDASCGTFTFKNMKDAEGYLLWVKGPASGTCSFQAEGLTFFYPPNHGATDAESRTVYSFTRIGHEVVVTWTRGY